MRDNIGILVAALTLLGATGMCCVAGAGYYVLRQVNHGIALGGVGPSPSMPAPVAPPPIARPTGPALPAPLPPAIPAGALLGETVDTPVRGPEGALAIHVIADYQCPFSGRVQATLAQIDAANPGRIRWVWHDYPLPFHDNALPAAEAAREVRAQLGDDAFWRYHDMLFAGQRDLSMPMLERLASAMPGIDMPRFRAAMASHVHQAAITTSIATVDATHGAGGTPSFQIGTAWLVGAQPAAAFQAEIDRQPR